MKTFGMAMLLLGSMAAQAFADVKIDQVLVRRKGQDINLRVVISNPGKTRQPGPVKIDLYVRDTPDKPWEKITSWNDIAFIQPGYKVARDFFEENNETLRALAVDGAFETRAVVSLPNGAKGVETVYSWKDNEKGK